MKENLEALLFSPAEARVGLSQADAVRLKAYETLFNRWMENVHLPDAVMVSWAEQELGIPRRTAYRYIADVKELLSRVNTPSRAWYRHQVTQMLLQAYGMALAAEDRRGMIAAADALGKYTNLDKPDVDTVDWSEVVPPSFEPSGDVSLVGVDAPTAEEYSTLRARLSRKYKLPQPTLSNTDVVRIACENEGENGQEEE